MVEPLWLNYFSVSHPKHNLLKKKNTERKFSSEHKSLFKKVLSTFFGELDIEKLKTLAFLFQTKGKYTNVSKKVKI